MNRILRIKRYQGKQSISTGIGQTEACRKPINKGFRLAPISGNHPPLVRAGIPDTKPSPIGSLSPEQALYQTGLLFQALGIGRSSARLHRYGSYGCGPHHCSYVILLFCCVILYCKRAALSPVRMPEQVIFSTSRGIHY